LPGIEKKYIIFTDGEVPESPENAIVYNQEHLEWPYITLYRFKMIQKCFEDIQDCDWLLFLDADMRVVDTVIAEDLFDDSKKYIGVHHPCHYLNMPPHNELPGAFDVTPYVLDMIQELDQKTTEDEKNNIIATWHDESHLNKFYIEHRDEVFVASPSLAYPEVFAKVCTFEPKIVHLSKDNSKYHV
jgi:hypothetical protein